MTTQTQLQEAEAAINALAPEFQKEAPEQFAKLKKVLEGLKKAPAGKPQSDEVKKLVVDLVRWQFEVQLNDAQSQHEALKKAAAESGDAAVEKTAVALGELVKFLTEAKNAGLPPSASAAAALEASGAKVKKAFDDASAAAARSTLDIPLRTLRRPIASASGVPLKAVVPPPRAAAGGSPFKPRAPAAPKAAKPPAAFGKPAK